jgi:hypothetical protein
LGSSGVGAVVTGFVVVLAVLQLAVPVRCYSSEPAFVAAGGLGAAAFYEPGEFIALSPDTCRQVRRPSWYGAFVLGHELAHLWQDLNGRSFDEGEADRIGEWSARGLLLRLVQVTGRRAVSVRPDRPVVLGP